MYDELFAAWKSEVENSELGRLPSDFYIRLISYLTHADEASKSINEKNLKAVLLEREVANIKLMVNELVLIRYRKIIKRIIGGQAVPPEVLAAEEAQLYYNLSPSADAYNKFASALLAGQVVAVPEFSSPVKADTVKPESIKIDAKSVPAAVESVPAPTVAPVATHKRVVVRFLKQVPSIIGADMKAYGPFMPEDVASLPESNAKILIRQVLAKLIEVP